MADIVWAARAQRELNVVVGLIRSRNAAAATKLFRQFRRAVDRLKKIPELGSAVEDYPRAGLREVIVSHYRVIYFFDPIGGVVTIARVIDGRRDVHPTTEADTDA